jgi:ABC-type dipeptide/oligopeptide/nickel transport system permease subunit
MTGCNLAVGLSIGWGAGLLLASSGMWRRLSGLRPMWVTCSGAMLCIPSALAAFGIVLINAPAGLAVAVAICPRIFRYADNLFRALGRRAHVLCAQVKGLSDCRVLGVCRRENPRPQPGKHPPAGLGADRLRFVSQRTL